MQATFSILKHDISKMHTRANF